MRPSEHPPALVLRGAHVLDERGGFTDPLDVVARDGKVTAVGHDLPREPDLREVDAAGLWLLPGIVDCHAHIGLHSFDTLETQGTPQSLVTLETAQALRRTLQAGVTLLRDAGGIDAGVRDAVARGYVPGPHLQVSVLALGPAGGGSRDGPDKMRRAVRRVLRSGADWIKLMATAGVMAAGEGMFEAELSAEEMAVAVMEASRRGKGVMVHALGGPAIRAAVEAGARSVEHAMFLTEADARLMAARGCAFVPTLAIYRELARLAASGELGAIASRRMAQVAPRLGEAVRIARAAGVQITLGSDFGHRDQHGRNLAELHYLHQAGLTVEEALLAGTAGGAALCGAGERLGRIAPGYAFDALLLDADPGDLSCFLQPDAVGGVFKGGVPVLPHPRLDT